MIENKNLLGSIVALITPMKEDASLDEESFESLLKWHIQNGTSGVIIGGTTGESPTLTQKELQKMVELAQPYRENLSLFLGAGGNNTELVSALAQERSSWGVDALLSVVPYYNKPPQAGIFAHFSKIAKASKLPLVLYDVPSRTGVSLAPQTVQKLFLELGDQILGLKFAREDENALLEVRELCGDSFLIYGGEDSLALSFYQKAKIQGAMNVTGNVLPKEVAQLWSLLKENQLEEATHLNHKLTPFYQLMFQESNPIPAKYCLAKMKRIQSERLRLPLVPLSSKLRPSFDAMLQEKGLLS